MGPPGGSPVPSSLPETPPPHPSPSEGHLAVIRLVRRPFLGREHGRVDVEGVIARVLAVLQAEVDDLDLLAALHEPQAPGQEGRHAESLACAILQLDDADGAELAIERAAV